MKSASTTDTPVIGILYPGEMGVALANVLLSRGFDVITTLNGRSARTVDFCQQSSGMQTRQSIADVVADADIIFSTVTPDAALSVAATVRQEAVPQDRPFIYVDANSVSPQTVARIASEFRDSAVGFVDAAIHGIAGRLRTQGTIFTSGPEADVISRLFSTDVRVRRLGHEPGSASLMKMMLGGMSKGIIGLFLQSSLLARNFDVADDFCEELGRYYPDVLSFVERSLPTYPQHAGRRAQEMREFEATLHLNGQPADMASALSRMFSVMAESDLADACEGESQPIPLTRLVDVISKTRRPVQDNHSETALV